jgi:hypothetical protein
MLVESAVFLALAAHAPVIVHDSRERYPLASVATAEVPVPGIGRDRRPTVYGRAVGASSDTTWLQYWFFYPHQDQDRGILRTGRHAGDWELVQYRLDPRGRPVEAVYSQHSGAERCPWQTVRRRGGRPLVFAARGSHASYLRPGTRDRMWPDPNDEANGVGAVVRARLVRIGRTSPLWIRWAGRWGRARARWWMPAEQDSPLGPAFQEDRWADPGFWARKARPCQAACDRVGECDTAENLLTGGALVAVLGGVGFAAAATRRRRRGRI